MNFFECYKKDETCEGKVEVVDEFVSADMQDDYYLYACEKHFKEYLKEA